MRQIKLAYMTDLLSARENGASYRRRCDADAGCVVVSLMYATWSVGTRHDAVCCGCRLWRLAATVTQCRVCRHASGMNTLIVACALVGFRLDYANSVLFGITRRNISKLQKAKNFLARGRCNGPSSSILQFTYSSAAPLASH